MEVTRDEFTEGLADALAVIERLTPYCQNINELLGLLRLAVGKEGDKGNGAQVRLLMDVVIPPASRK